MTTAFLKAHTRLMPEREPAHNRIAKANAREGGRHRRATAWLGEKTHARHEGSEFNPFGCPSCRPETYATHFARHRR